MKKISTVKSKSGESNQDFFDRRLRVAMANYREAVAIKENESWTDRLDRFRSFNKDFGLDYILKLRKNLHDTQKKVDKRKSVYQKHWKEIEESEIKQLDKDYKEKLKTLADDHKKNIEDVKQSKVDDVFNKIKAKSMFEKELNEETEKEEQEKITSEEKEVYDKKIFKAFLMFIGIVFICLFVKLYFISSFLGYTSLIVFVSLIIYFSNSDDIYNKVNDNKWYRMIMNFMFKFSSITSGVLKTAGHVTIRK